MNYVIIALVVAVVIEVLYLVVKVFHKDYYLDKSVKYRYRVRCKHITVRHGWVVVVEIDGEGVQYEVSTDLWYSFAAGDYIAFYPVRSRKDQTVIRWDMV